MIVNHQLGRALALLFAFVALGGVAVGCGDSEADKGPAEDLSSGSADGDVSQEPAPIQVAFGLGSGVRVKEPTPVVIHDRAALAKIVKQLNDGPENATIPGTDFDERQLVGVFMPKQKAGTQLAITTVEQDEKEKMIKISATVVSPGKGCKVPKGEKTSYPYQIVQTRKMEGSPYLALEKTRGASC